MAVGIGREHGQYVFRLMDYINPVGFHSGTAPAPPPEIEGIRVVATQSQEEIRLLTLVKFHSSGQRADRIDQDEQQLWRQLYCGLEIHNFDEDERAGRIAGFSVKVGTLGCFVRDEN